MRPPGRGGVPAAAADNRRFVQPSTPLPGTQDLLYEAARRLRRCEAILCERFERAGYAEVIPPAIEGADVFGPEAFRALDRNGKLVAMRADFTAQVARIAATRLAGDWRGGACGWTPRAGQRALAGAA